jgi:hypothetical protein
MHRSPALRRGVVRVLRGQVAVFLSCSDKFRETLARPVRDALAGHGLRGIILSDEPPLPGGSTADAAAGPYLDASSAFVALCAADYELSDGTRYPRASVIGEIQQALSRPHLRDRTQVLKAPGVLLPSDITPSYDSLDVAKPAVAAEVILKQLQQWGIAGPGDVAAAPPHRVGACQPDEVDALLAGAPPADRDDARGRVYPLLRDRSEDRRRWIASELCRETMESARDARALAASALLQAVSALDAALVPGEMVEALATHPGYQARACAAQLLRNRAAIAPLGVPVEVLGRLALPGAEDWLVWAPAMAAVQELVLHRRDAYVILESLGTSADARDRFAVAAALLAIAQVRPAAVARGLAAKLADDADRLVAAKAAEVMSATEQVTERDHAACYGRFWGAAEAGE